MTQTSGGQTRVQGLAEWRQMMSDISPTFSCTSQELPRFDAEITRRQVGSIWLSTIAASAHRVEHSGGATHADDPSYAIQLQLSGTGTVTQGGRTVRLSPGDFVVLDSSLPGWCDFPTRSSIFVATFPQHLISLTPRLRASLAAQRMPGDRGLSAVASALMSAVARDLPVVDRSPLRVSVAHCLHELVEAALTESLTTFGSPGSAGAGPLEGVVEVCDWIMQRLGERDLSPERIAAAHFISVRKLQGMFNEHGTTVTEWIRDRRLDMARRDLEMPRRQDVLVGDIAYKWGFSDPSYFARAFRVAYGVSPRAFRSRSLQAALPVLGPPSADSVQTRT